MAKDRDEVVAFHDLPVERLKHIRTTNLAENVFATVRNRMHDTIGFFDRKAAQVMV
ncbi:MAG: hypothetical protein J4F49_09345 [Rhodobacteraceae bacterium]|nr:hypothetical protein [Paracoccaceae bacterium]